MRLMACARASGGSVLTMENGEASRDRKIARGGRAAAGGSRGRRAAAGGSRGGQGIGGSPPGDVAPKPRHSGWPNASATPGHSLANPPARAHANKPLAWLSPPAHRPYTAGASHCHLAPKHRWCSQPLSRGSPRSRRRGESRTSRCRPSRQTKATSCACAPPSVSRPHRPRCGPSCRIARGRSG